ncbi:hypothetical protein QJS10_CPA01g02805 [Acorus calamus]|uniref:glycine--tRNA ligase n=1 Tax=Acorus calamus TaxID=4465 RepID=A0AAV9FGC5_ACOCL|nr:hypothetical protein QJS10_CPA01g02805 [Acorus calamus]
MSTSMAPQPLVLDPKSSAKASVPTFQQAIQRLQVGAGTMNPLTFLRVLGPEPWNVAYVEPSVRPDDSRYGDNPNRLQRHTQFQVILKPDPGNSQDLFISSLSALGINVNEHDIRFVEDNWESPAGSLQLQPVSVEITYGLERILMLLQGVDHFKKIQYADGITYGELFLENEYDQLLKTSHAFNVLDSRGFVGVTERARYFGRMRSLARQCAQLWVKVRESLGHPLGVSSEADDLVYSREVLDLELRKVVEEPRVFVLEIGTEELPPQDVIDASEQIHVHGLNSKQSENETDVRGPPTTKAFDDNGNPTKAAEGFCRKYGVPLDSMFKKADGKMDYVYVRVKESTRFSVEVLAAELPNILSRISFSKSMRWNSQVMFSRPIRWILALHGSALVPFAFAGILSGKLSRGLRNSSSAGLEVECAESYADLVTKAGILIDVEVVNLVEAPVPILGRFDESFLELPKDILIMVANGIINETVVRKGNEAVLRARYEDAKFFYKMDTQKKFSEFRSQLNGILFHEKLGTMLDKTTRIQKTVSKLSSMMGMDKDIVPVVQDAASLAMSDLSTSIVTEFTSLSGIMARHYALRDGYTEQIAEALFEITLPRFSGDVLPKSDAGIILSIADRLDSLVGLFGAGCQPSSSNDPFGLRRIAYGLVQVLVENGINLNLEHALRLAADVQPIGLDANIINDAHQFVTRRLEQLLVDKGINSEIVRSVLVERANWPSLAAQSAIKMEALSKGELLPKVVEAYSRPTRIIRGKDMDVDSEVNEAAFKTDEERALWNAFLEVRTKIHPGIEIDEFVNTSLQLQQPLEDFFNHVFVMVDDEMVRKNRLSLLKKIADLPKGIADLSVLPGF